MPNELIEYDDQGTKNPGEIIGVEIWDDWSAPTLLIRQQNGGLIRRQDVSPSPANSDIVDLPPVTCATCKFKYFRNAIVGGSRKRDVRYVCAFDTKNPNKGYAKSITVKSYAAQPYEFLLACDNYVKAPSLTEGGNHG